MRKVRILEDTTGSVDHIHTQEYEEGEVLECDGRRMSEELAGILIDGGDAEWVSEEKGPEETKPQGPDETKPDGPEETKEASPEEEVKDTVVASYDAPEGSSWKTFFDEDGWELGSAQVSEEEADFAVDEGLTLSEVKEL